MRILTVSAFYESHGGGIEIVAGATARALASLGHECLWAGASFDEPPSDSKVKAVPLPASDPLERWTGLPMPLLNKEARHLLDREVAAADAIIIHDALYSSSLLAARSAQRHGKPWILVQHIGAIPYTSKLLRGLLACANLFVTRRMLSKAPQAVFISDEVRRFFDGVEWKSSPKLLLNGVDHQSFFEAAPEERRQLRQRFDLSDSRRELLFVGRMVEKKGLAAIRALAEAKPEWGISLIGTGPIDPKAWNLPNVRVMGRRSREELGELYRAADALVLPSVGEGFPLVIQEAMASGLPVFCGLDSAAADPGARGLIHAVKVDPADPTGTSMRFAKSIEEARGFPGKSEAAYARRTYSWDTNARWFVSRFEELAFANTASARTSFAAS